MEKAKKHILQNFKVIHDEAWARIKDLKYHPVHAWGANDKTDYTMPNNEFFDYWVKGWNNSDKWLSHLLSVGENGQMVNGDSKTVRILNEAGKMMDKKLIMAGYAMLRPGGTIDTHKDEEESRGWNNVWHLGLFVSEGCSLIVAGDEGRPTVHAEAIAKLIEFDDSQYHGAINNGPKDRVILYMKWV